MFSRNFERRRHNDNSQATTHSSLPSTPMTHTKNISRVSWKRNSNMRTLHPASKLLIILSCLLLSTKLVLAGPQRRDIPHDAGFFYLFGRTCATYCGADNQYCCGSGEACFTNQANIAYCSAGGDSVGGGFAIFTTTYTETNFVLRTSTYTSSWGVPTPASPPGPVITAPAICTTSLGESSCGAICCASNQRCAFANSCTAYSSVFLGHTKSSTFSAPVRPTSGDLYTFSATTTVPFETPATATGSTLPIFSEDSNSLSGGAVAGIVIGVVAGIFLLLLLCFCCIVKKGWAGILALFGLGGKKRTDDSYGDRPPTPATEKKKGNGFWGFLGGALLASAAVLGFSSLRKGDSKSGSSSNDPSGRFYSDSYTGSIGSESTDESERETRLSER